MEDPPPLALHWRVLELAQDASRSLPDRVRFFTVAASTLDRLFTIRVAGLQQQAAGKKVGRAGAATQRLAEIRRESLRLTRALSATWTTELHPALDAAGVRVLEHGELAPAQAAWARAYFDAMVMPVLTPLAFDPGRPFPHISSLSVNLAVVVDDRGVDRFARIKVPTTLPRLVPVGSAPGAGGGAPGTAPRHAFVWLEGLIAAHVDRLFPGVKVKGVHPFHVTRDAELGLEDPDEEELPARDARSAGEGRFGPVVRLIVTPGMPDHVRDLLVENLEIEAGDVQAVEGPLALSAVVALAPIAANGPATATVTRAGAADPA
jgi:polyphosphate kinase